MANQGSDDDLSPEELEEVEALIRLEDERDRRHREWRSMRVLRTATIVVGSLLLVSAFVWAASAVALPFFVHDSSGFESQKVAVWVEVLDNAQRTSLSVAAASLFILGGLLLVNELLRRTPWRPEPIEDDEGEGGPGLGLPASPEVARPG